NLINFYLNHDGDNLVEKFKKKQSKGFVKNLVKVFDWHKDEFPVKGLSVKNTWEDPEIDNNIYKFLVDTLIHDFYGIIKSELNLQQRSNGKGIAFRTVFAKPKPENEQVRQLRSIYPTVINIINGFKEKYGYNQFAIGLQQVEAEIFIDHIWKKVLALPINAFTRHDSIVFPIEKKQDVEKVITEVFADFDFIYRIEYESFNPEELESHLFENTNFVENSEDYDEVFFYTMFEAKKDAKKRTRQNIQMDRIYERLEDIELPETIEDDYYKFVSLDKLSMIYELEDLSEEIRLSLEEDIANLQSNYPVPFFQGKTNALIRWLVKLK
ncbi:MAG: hypothetical protein ABSA76_16250, partial [Bacteroidales bacterium]